MTKETLYWIGSGLSLVGFLYSMDWYRKNPEAMDFRTMSQFKKALIKDGWKHKKGFTYTKVEKFHRVPLLNVWPFNKIIVTRKISND